MNTQSDNSVNTVATTDPAENEWKRLFVITEHWRSDMQFFAHELQFLRSLMDRHFAKLIKEEHIDSTKATVSKLGKLENRRSNCEQKIDRHYHHMTNLIEDPFPHDAQSYRDEHGRLEAAMADFVKDFRAIKMQVFHLAKQVMDEEKTSHLLSK